MVRVQFSVGLWAKKDALPRGVGKDVYTATFFVYVELMQMSDTFQVNLSPQMGHLLSQLAEQQHKAVPVIAEQLLLEALELQEDKALSAFADARLASHTRWVSHEDAWK